jgi:hypothetical protein
VTGEYIGQRETTGDGLCLWRGSGEYFTKIWRLRSTPAPVPQRGYAATLPAECVVAARRDNLSNVRNLDSSFHVYSQFDARCIMALYATARTNVIGVSNKPVSDTSITITWLSLKNEQLLSFLNGQCGMMYAIVCVCVVCAVYIYSLCN